MKTDALSGQQGSFASKRAANPPALESAKSPIRSDHPVTGHLRDIRPPQQGYRGKRTGIPFQGLTNGTAGAATNMRGQEFVGCHAAAGNFPGGGIDTLLK